MSSYSSHPYSAYNRDRERDRGYDNARREPVAHPSREGMIPRGGGSTAGGGAGGRRDPSPVGRRSVSPGYGRPREYDRDRERDRDWDRDRDRDRDRVDRYPTGAKYGGNPPRARSPPTGPGETRGGQHPHRSDNSPINSNDTGSDRGSDRDRDRGLPRPHPPTMYAPPSSTSYPTGPKKNGSTRAGPAGVGAERPKNSASGGGKRKEGLTAIPTTSPQNKSGPPGSTTKGPGSLPPIDISSANTTSSNGNAAGGSANSWATRKTADASGSGSAVPGSARQGDAQNRPINVFGDEDEDEPMTPPIEDVLNANRAGEGDGAGREGSGHPQAQGQDNGKGKERERRETGSGRDSRDRDRNRSRSRSRSRSRDKGGRRHSRERSRDRNRRRDDDRRRSGADNVEKLLPLELAEQVIILQTAAKKASDRYDLLLEQLTFLLQLERDPDPRIQNEMDRTIQERRDQVSSASLIRGHAIDDASRALETAVKGIAGIKGRLTWQTQGMDEKDLQALVEELKKAVGAPTAGVAGQQVQEVEQTQQDSSAMDIDPPAAITATPSFSAPALVTPQAVAEQAPLQNQPDQPAEPVTPTSVNLEQQRERKSGLIKIRFEAVENRVETLQATVDSRFTELEASIFDQVDRMNEMEEDRKMIDEMKQIMKREREARKKIEEKMAANAVAQPVPAPAPTPPLPSHTAPGPAAESKADELRTLSRAWDERMSTFSREVAGEFHKLRMENGLALEQERRTRAQVKQELTQAVEQERGARIEMENKLNTALGRITVLEGCRLGNIDQFNGLIERLNILDQRIANINTNVETFLQSTQSEVQNVMNKQTDHGEALDDLAQRYDDFRASYDRRQAARLAKRGGTSEPPVERNQTPNASPHLGSTNGGQFPNANVQSESQSQPQYRAGNSQQSSVGGWGQQSGQAGGSGGGGGSSQYQVLNGSGVQAAAQQLMDQQQYLQSQQNHQPQQQQRPALLERMSSSGSGQAPLASLLPNDNNTNNRQASGSGTGPRQQHGQGQYNNGQRGGGQGGNLLNRIT